MALSTDSSKKGLPEQIAPFCHVLSHVPSQRNRIFLGQDSFGISSPPKTGSFNSGADGTFITETLSELIWVKERP